MDLGKIINPSREMRITVEVFAKLFADQSIREYLEQPQFSDLISLAKSGASWSKLGQKYTDITGAGIPDRIVIGVLVARLYGRDSRRDRLFKL